ncbi:peptide chain release factor N(5)-glutamine methyltransferase [Dermabacter hominis]|uniref:peptide chain release factor N(5)-glutamine methyltransferase n=1 Tax=Dermabacter hominis TaxID=36740 RepID=UPI002A4A251D|nr:peptide chain release factor N(5)-glutamine methyltransferase [Dermabacter hominis]
MNEHRAPAAHNGLSVSQRVALARRGARARLHAAGIASAEAEARLIVLHAAQAETSLVLLDQLPETFEADVDAILARRERREPLQLILGQAPFRHLTLETARGVFIPRPETETALDIAHDWTREEGRRASDPLYALDACTGSGTLAAALLDEFPAARVSAFDVNPRAAELAQRNCTASGPGRFRVFHAELPTCLTELDGFIDTHIPERPLDLVIANPPYIPARAIPAETEVREYDPHEALFGGGESGLDVPRAVINLAARLLRPRGLLIMEHDESQGAPTRALAAETQSFDTIKTARDLTGRDRFLVARAAQQVRE